jgi:ribosome-binding ATPase YchF (GTP1/OBG family)
MSFSCGFIGLPNSGKSTIFNALTALAVPCQPYPFCTIDPNVGVVPVPDARLFGLADLLKPEKVTQTTIEFVDIAGHQGRPQGGGPGEQVPFPHQNVDAVAHVIRAFNSGQVPMCMPISIQPGTWISWRRKIIISDLEIVEIA